MVPVDGGGDSGLYQSGGLPEFGSVNLVADLSVELSGPGLPGIVRDVVEGVAVGEITDKNDRLEVSYSLDRV